MFVYLDKSWDIIKHSFVPVDAVGHNVVEVFGSDETILVKVGLGEGGLDFFVSQVFSQILGHFFQFHPSEFTLSLLNNVQIG